MAFTMWPRIEAIDYDAWKLNSGEPEDVNCPLCRGTGEIDEDQGMIDCPCCDGSGEVSEADARKIAATFCLDMED